MSLVVLGNSINFVKHMYIQCQIVYVHTYPGDKSHPIKVSWSSISVAYVFLTSCYESDIFNDYIHTVSLLE